MSCSYYFNEILNTAKERGPKDSRSCFGRQACLEAVADARRYGIAESILVGNAAKTISLLKEIDCDISWFEIIHEDDMAEAAKKQCP